MRAEFLLREPGRSGTERSGVPDSYRVLFTHLKHTRLIYAPLRYSKDRMAFCRIVGILRFAQNDGITQHFSGSELLVRVGS